MRTIGLIFFALILAGTIRAQIPVTDVASITANQIAHAEEIAKWVESISQLRTQIDQLNQQINIQSDIRKWTGDPVAAGGNMVIDALGAQDLVRSFGRAENAIVAVEDSLASLKNTAQGTYRLIQDVDLEGNPMQHDLLTFRRFAVLDAQQQNYQQVVDDTKTREQQLQADLAVTLDALKNAPTDAEVQKQSAKVNAINGQLAALSAARRDEADQVAAQKIANDARSEEERLAAEELALKDDYLANQRITAYMKTIKFRQSESP
ncbi:MAG TPA: hypothetical protein VK717_01755 [Opitutaceae bacterium]|jgi:hypothetical protein|nr:hypothetical protein [Opitutaceae bacterium]